MNISTNVKRKTHSMRNTADFHLPVLIVDAGEQAEKRFVEFFTANIRNPNTRMAYLRSINQFMIWCSATNKRTRQANIAKTRKANA